MSIRRRIRRLQRAGGILAVLALTGAIAVPASAKGPIDTLGSARHIIIPQARSFELTQRINPNVVAPIDITSVGAKVEIREQTATTTLDVALRNTSSSRQEAALLLPVPDGAVVSSFAFEGSASEPTAQVLSRDEARRLYDAIVARVLDPALLEFAGYNLIRSSVFPVPPGGTQRIRVTYEHLVPADGDRVDYVLPRSESLTHRQPWQIEVDIVSAHPISTVYSPSHSVLENRIDPNHVRVVLDRATTDEPGAFRLSYLLDREGANRGVTASLLAYPDPAVGGGYFLLMAGLPATIDDVSERIRREVTLVIDRSGSMAGPKMDQAKAAALQVIEGLAEGESFNILDYSSTVSAFSTAPVPKDRENIIAARAYLDTITPGGGTNIHDALLEALRQEPTEAKLPIVLFLTDGVPTVGRTSETTIRQMVADANPHGRRVFTFGVGADVNAPLLDRVAEVSRGTSTYVLPDEDVELKVARVFRRLYGPVFAEPVLATTETDGTPSTRLVYDLIPHALPDLFDGDQLILLGRYREEKPMTFRLSGNFLGAERTFEFTFDLDAATTRNAFVPRLWASRRIGLLVDEIRQAGAIAAEHPHVVGASLLDEPRYAELVNEILRLSTEFGILTEYTAFLATEGTNLGDHAALFAGCSMQLDQRAVRTRSGTEALNQSFNCSWQKGQKVLNYGNSFVDAKLERVDFSAVQQLCDRAFFRRGNRWIDSRLVAYHEVAPIDQVITIGSDAHFELLRRLVREGRQSVLSLRGEILLQLDDEIVVLIQDGC